MHTVFALLCFVVVIHWLFFPYPSGLLHWHCGNLTIAPVPAKQPWWIWINTSCEFIMNDCITTTKQSTTKPCAYFLGYTVSQRGLVMVISWCANTAALLALWEGNPLVFNQHIYILGNVFHITGPLWGNPLVTSGFPHKGSVIQSLDILLLSAWTSCGTNSRDASHLRHHDTYGTSLWWTIYPQDNPTYPHVTISHGMISVDKSTETPICNND